MNSYRLKVTIATEDGEVLDQVNVVELVETDRRELAAEIIEQIELKFNTEAV